MKTYMSDKRISMVGRVWEIRRYLKLAQRKLTKDTSLLTYLAEQTNYAHAQARSFGLDEEPTSVPLTSNPMLHQPQSQFLQNTQHRHVIPFPSWK
jgi:hypothetical protein